MRSERSFVGCPEAALLAAYLDRRLGHVDRARIEGHVARCEACLDVVADVIALNDDTSRPTDAPPETCPPLRRLVAAAAVLVVTLLPVWAITLGGTRATVTTVDSLPHGEGRLTGMLVAPHSRDSLLHGEITAMDLHAEGLANVARGFVDDGITLLTAAVHADPHTATFQSDVAAGYMARAAQSDLAVDDFRAIGAAQRAVLLDPEFAEARYNRALALERLGLLSLARAAWSDYLSLDPSSPWAERARRHLGALPTASPADQWAELESKLRHHIDVATAEEGVRSQTSALRRFLEGVLLPKWAATVLDGANAAADRERLRVIAEAFHRLTGDRLYSGLVAVIDRAESQGPSALSHLAQAHLDYARAATLLGEDGYLAAQAGLDRATRALAEARSPYSQRARLDLGMAAHYTGQISGTAEMLTELTARADDDSLTFVASRVRWLRGLSAFDRGEYVAAQRLWEEMLTRAQRMNDGEEIAAAHGLLSNLWFHLGKSETAWQHRRAYLHLLGLHDAPRIRFGLLMSAAGQAFQEDPAAALALQDAVIQEVTFRGRVAALPEAYGQRAMINAALRRYSNAKADMSRAIAALSRVGDAALRRRLEPHLRLAEVRMLDILGDPRTSFVAARALSDAEAHGDVVTRPHLYLLLGQAYLRQGLFSEAASAAQAGLDAHLNPRTGGGLTSVAPRELVKLSQVAMRAALAMGDVATAYRHGAMARARSIGPDETTHPSLDYTQAQRRLEDGQVLLAMNQINDELVLWLVTTSSVEYRIRRLTRQEAERLVAMQQADIARAASRSPASTALFRELVRPFGARLTGARHVVIAADAPYFAASFAALFDRPSGRFWIETTSISLASTVPDLRASTGDATFIDVPATATPMQAFDMWRVAGPRAIVHLSARVTANHATPELSLLRFDDGLGLPYSGLVLTGELPQFPPVRGIVLSNIDPGSVAAAGAGSFDAARTFLKKGATHVITSVAKANLTSQESATLRHYLETAPSIPSAVARVQLNAAKRTGRLGSWCQLVVYESESLN